MSFLAMTFANANSCGERQKNDRRMTSKMINKRTTSMAETCHLSLPQFEPTPLPAPVLFCCMHFASDGLGKNVSKEVCERHTPKFMADKSIVD